MAPIRLLLPDEPTTITEVGTLRPSSPGVAQSPLRPAVTPPRRMPVAALALLGLVLAAGIAATVVWRNRSPQPDLTAPNPGAGAVSAPAPSSTPESATAAPPATAPQPAASSASAPAGAVVPPPAPARPTVETAEARAPKVEPSLPRETAPATPAPEPPVPAVVASVTFPKVKFLVTEEGRTRDRDASVRLEPDAMQ